MFKTNHLWLFLSLLALNSVEASERFPSDIPGFDLGNAAYLSQRSSLGKVIRGRGPESAQDYQELVDFGITDVLIFKRETANRSVENEKRELSDRGIRHEHIPYKWERLDDFQQTCLMTVAGLQLMADIQSSSGRKIYTHCTHGEDRTGVLAGLHRMLHEGWSSQRAFNDELCRFGYEAGNPQKPFSVNQKIRGGLTPFFFQMAKAIEDGNLNLQNLKQSKLCQTLAKQVPSVDATPRRRCSKSPRFLD